MEYKLLPLEFDKYQFHFKELYRDGDYRIYEKSKDGYKSLEVCKLKYHNGYEIAGVKVEPAQSMPNNEEWGLLGFSPLTYEKCLEKIIWMKKQESEKPPQQIDNQGNPIKRGRGRPRKNPLT